MNVGAHIVVSGLVQGVGFRYFVHTRASRLGLCGEVTNLYDGNVQIEIEGDRSLIEELIKEVTVGPRSAKVSDVKVRWTDARRQFRTFQIH